MKEFSYIASLYLKGFTLAFGKFAALSLFYAAFAVIAALIINVLFDFEALNKENIIKIVALSFVMRYLTDATIDYVEENY